MTEDTHLLTDLVRLAFSVAALVLAATVFRLAWIRRHGSLGVHWAAYVSYALALILLAALRISHAGEDPTWDLWASIVVVAFGWYAIIKRVHWTLQPPWRR